MRFAAFFLLVVFFGLLWLPLAANTHPAIGGLFPRKLGGVENKVENVPLSLENLLNGSYQEKFEDWFSGNLQVRSALVRTDNQFNFSLFKHSGGRVIVGDDNYLFERYYIEDLNNVRPFPEEKLQEFADKLARLQNGLNKRGSQFLVLIAPSKAYLYPEKIPDRLLLPRQASDNYQNFKKLLEAKHIPFVDGVALLQTMKEDSEYPVFAPGGAHWTSDAACRVGEKLTEKFSDLLGKKTPLLRCNDTYIRNKPQGLDQDLSLLANLWTTKSIDAPLPYPKTTSVFPEGFYRPKVLFVGDSFMWPLFHYLDKQRVYEARDFFYYYKTHDLFRVGRKPKKVRLDPATLDWQKMLSRDVVVLEFNQARIPDAGFGFVEDALAKLEPETPVKHP